MQAPQQGHFEDTDCRYTIVVVPSEVWQCSRLVEGGEFALMGTAVAPGFEPQDYEQGNRDELTKMFPQHRDLIYSLT